MQMRTGDSSSEVGAVSGGDVTTGFLDEHKELFRFTARNFNPMMAMAGKVTVAEVEELVEIGELNANDIHTPSIFVQRIFKGTHFEKRIEFATTRES